MEMKIKNGSIIIGTETSTTIGSVKLIPDGYEISIDGMYYLSKEDWPGFVDLVNLIDKHIKDNHNE